MAMKPSTPKPISPMKKATPVPMPKKAATGTARKSSSGVKAKPSGTPKASVPKKKLTLDDFLLKGKRPPRAPGQKKLPSDSDVILKNYNDKKYKKGK